MGGTAIAAYQIFPRDVTTEEWERLANIECDRAFGEVRLPLSATIGSIGDAMLASTDLSRLDQTLVAVQTVAQNLEASAGSIKVLLGDVRAIEAPPSRRDEIDAALVAGDAYADNLSRLAHDVRGMRTALVQVDVPAFQAASLAATEDMARLSNSYFAWQEALDTLNLTRCPDWVADPVPIVVEAPATPIVTPTSAVATAVLTTAEAALAGAINPTVLAGCTGRPDQEFANVIAALNCTAESVGPVKRPLVVQLSDPAAAEAWFADNAGETGGVGDCSNGDWRGRWTSNGGDAGPMACLSTDDGGFRIVWVVDSYLVGVIAEGADPALMTAWFGTATVVATAP